MPSKRIAEAEYAAESDKTYVRRTGKVVKKPKPHLVRAHTVKAHKVRAHPVRAHDVREYEVRSYEVPEHWAKGGNMEGHYLAGRPAAKRPAAKRSRKVGGYEDTGSYANKHNPWQAFLSKKVREHPGVSRAELAKAFRDEYHRMKR